MNDRHRVTNEKIIMLSIVWLSVIFTALTILIYFFWFYFISNQQLSDSSADWGTFGDFIGGFGSTLLALFTIILIRKSISIQLDEFSRLSDLSEKQNIDNRFFNLLNLHNNLIKEHQGKINGKAFKGEEYLRELLTYYKRNENQLDEIKDDLQKRKISLLHIINNLATIIEFFKKKETSDVISSEDMEEHIEVLRTQLNSNELLILMYLVNNVNLDKEKILKESKIFKYFDSEENLPSKDKTVIKELLDTK